MLTSAALLMNSYAGDIVLSQHDPELAGKEYFEFEQKLGVMRNADAQRLMGAFIATPNFDGEPSALMNPRTAANSKPVMSSYDNNSRTDPHCFDDVETFLHRGPPPKAAAAHRRILHKGASVRRRELVHEAHWDRSGTIAVSPEHAREQRGKKEYEYITARVECHRRMTSPKRRRSKSGPRRASPPKVGCFVGGSMDLSPYLRAQESNPVHQSGVSLLGSQLTPRCVELPPALSLFRVALNHLQSVGLLPYVVDVQYRNSTHVLLTILPAHVHAPQLGGIHGVGPTHTVVKLYPIIARTIQGMGCPTNHTQLNPIWNPVLKENARPIMNDVLRFDPLADSVDRDIVLAFALDCETVDNIGWEPSFLEKEMRHRFFCGTRDSFQEQGLKDWQLKERREAMAIQSPNQSTQTGSQRWSSMPSSDVELNGIVPPSVPMKSTFQEHLTTYQGFDVCRDQLAAHGFTHTRWREFSYAFNSAVYVAIKRIQFVASLQLSEAQAKREDAKRK